MNEPKHTPGPYKVQQWSDCYTIFTDHPDYSVRSIADTVGDMPQDQVNAQLLAAAPEMLEALSRCKNELEELSFYLEAQCIFGTWKATIEKARAAIAKATGDAQI